MSQYGQEKKEEITTPTMSAIPGGKPPTEEKTDTVSSQASDLVNKGQKIASEVVDKAGEYTADARREVGELVRKYPLQSLLAGFGVGWLAGLALRRK